MRVGLFTTEIYANWVRKEELERWVCTDFFRDEP
jgi:hypothetical protein